MPRTRGKRGGVKNALKKAAAEAAEETNAESESVPVEDANPEQNVNENVEESGDAQPNNESVENDEEEATVKDVAPVQEAVDQSEKMDTEEKVAKIKKQKKWEKKAEEPKEPAYKPHTFPSFTNSSLIEKWEWHIKVYPIDQADIRSCILESVSKIAQETWMFIDNQNYGMGAFDMCIKSASDAATIVLKILAMPMAYRYLTLKVTRRGKNAEEVRKITKKKASVGEDENDLDEELDNLPYTEALEKATLLLDYTQTYVINKVKGQEKKRNLYVKYLPEGTSKELLKVLFPVANNLDIIKTSKGRRVGELNVSTIPNILGICNSYVTIHINTSRNITLDWNEENIEDNRLVKESFAEIPWEIIPRDFEYPYETVPYIEKDDINEYGRKRKREESQKLMERGKDRDGRRRDRDRGSRDGRPEVGDVLRMQHEMNERINSQMALLTGGHGPPGMMGGPPPGMYGPPPGGPGYRRDYRDDRRGGKGDRERKNSSSGHGEEGGRDKPRGRDKEEKKTRWDKNDGTSTDGEGRRSIGKEVSPQGKPGRFDAPAGDRGSWGGDGGRWGRFDEPRGGSSRRGGGRFDDSRRGRFDDGPPMGGRGGRFNDFGRGGGGGGRFGDRGSGRFEGNGRPGMMGEAPGMNMGRGGRFDRGGPRGGGAFGQGMGGGNNQGYGGYNQGGGGNQSGNMGDYQNQGGYGNQMGEGGYGNQYNQSGGYMNQGGNQSMNNFGQGAQGGGFGNQAYGNQQNQSSSFGNQQNQSNSYGNQQNQAGGYGNQQNQMGGYNNMSVQGAGTFGDQSKQTGGYGNQMKQSTNYGNQTDQSTSGNYNYASQNMGTNQPPGAYPGNQDASKVTPASGMQSGGQMNNQTGYNMTAQSTVDNTAGMKNQASKTQAQTTLGTQNQQSMGTQNMGTQNQQNMGSYGTQQQQSNYSTQGAYGNQNYGSYDDGSYQQNYMNQQQVYAGYNTADNSGAWSQPQSDFSQYGQNQNTTNQASYSTTTGTSGVGQTDSYNTASYNTQAAGYSADAAFANQGFYAAPRSTTGTGNAAYGEYSTQDQSAAYATGNSTNLSNMATYNFASYNTGGTGTGS